MPATFKSCLNRKKNWTQIFGSDKFFRPIVTDFDFTYFFGFGATSVRSKGQCALSEESYSDFFLPFMIKYAAVQLCYLYYICIWYDIEKSYSGGTHLAGVVWRPDVMSQRHYYWYGEKVFVRIKVNYQAVLEIPASTHS